MTELSSDVTGAGFAGNVGITLTEQGPNEVRAQLEIRPDHLDHDGNLHHGIHATLVESLASVGAYLAGMEDGVPVVGAANDCHVHHEIQEGTVHAVARRIHYDQGGQFWTVEITAEDGTLLATGDLRLAHLPAGAESTVGRGAGQR